METIVTKDNITVKLLLIKLIEGKMGKSECGWISSNIITNIKKYSHIINQVIVV